MGFAARLARLFTGRRPSDHGAIDTDFVHEVIAKDVALAAGLDAELTTHLVSLTQELASDKDWEAAAGFDLTDEMIVILAANAALPILGLDPWVYRMVKSVIIHPSTMMAHGIRSGAGRGTVSDAAMAVVGVATPNSGPVTLSWDTALANSRNPARGHNVVIHEFAHKIDMSDGYTDGLPPVQGIDLDRWEAVLVDEYERTKTRPSDKVLRDYAWTNRAEFFAVSSEAFFCQPSRLMAGKPELYDVLANFYHQNPAERTR